MKKSTKSKASSKKVANSRNSSLFANSKFWILGILLLTSVVYLPSLSNGFTNWDDQGYVLENALLQDVSWNGLIEIVSTPIGANFHPLTMLSLALNYQISELDPFSYHFLNLLLHLVNTALVFVFIYALSGKKMEVAVIASLFFGIHPMHVESVAWIAERKDVLYTAFFLGSLIFYLRFLDDGKQKDYWWSFLFFVLSLLSKPAAVVLPVVLILIDYLRNRNLLDQKRLLQKIPFFILSFFLGWYTLQVQTEFGATTNEEIYTIVEKLMFASHSIFIYLIKLFVPYGLSAFYPFPSASDGLSLSYQLAPFALLIAATITYYYFRKNREVIFGLLFFLVNIALVLQIISVGNSIISERYTYVSYLGIFFVIGMGYSNLITNEKYRNSAYKNAFQITLLIAAIAYSAQSFTQTKVWKNSETLWTKSVTVFPQSYTAWYNRGLFYDEENKYEKAISDYSNAIANKPNFVKALVNRSRLLLKMNDPNQALADLNAAISFDPKMANAYVYRGNTYVDLKNFDLAIIDYSKALELEPDNSFAYQGRGNAHYFLGEYPKAIEDYSRVIGLVPNHVDANFNLGICYANIGDKETAKKYVYMAQSLGKPISQDLINWLNN